MHPSKSRLSLVIIEIIALKDRQHCPKQRKWRKILSQNETFSTLEKLQISCYLMFMCTDAPGAGKRPGPLGKRKSSEKRESCFLPHQKILFLAGVIAL